MTPSAAPRLFAVRHLAIMHVFCLFVVAVFAAMASLETGAVRFAAWGVALAGLLLWAAVIRSTAVTRRREPVEPRPDASVVVESAPAIAGLLVAAWVVMLLAVVGWVVVAVTDFSSIESPGFTLVMVLAALGSLPDLVRLLTGRLHRWRVVADDSGIRYRGYHTDRSLAWNEISSIRAQATPPGVTVESKDGTPALLVPALPFDEHPDTIAEALNQRRTRSLRR